MQEEEPPDFNKIKKFKNKENYVKAMSKGGRQTEEAAKTWIVAPINSWEPEEILEIVPKHLVIPSKTYPNGAVRSERYVAFVVVRTTKPINPDNPEYNKRRYRILAFWHKTPSFTSQDLEYNPPIGGLMGMGGYYTHVWVDKEFRGSNLGFNLYKELLKFGKETGLMVDLAPEQAVCGDCGHFGIPVQYNPVPCPKCGSAVQPLTSKSFRASKAKYDWERSLK